MAKYWGIASGNGLESFIYEPTTGFSGFDQLVHGEDIKPKSDESKKMAHQTVYWNRHRHSVLYEADIERADAKEIEKLLETDPFEALIVLKKKAKKIMIADMAGSKKSWDLIPNKNLDPFS